MKKIILYTSTLCPKCPKAKEVLMELVKELNLEEGEDYEVINVDIEDNYLKALRYNVASTPTFLIGDEIFFNRSLPTKEELKQLIL